MLIKRVVQVVNCGTFVVLGLLNALYGLVIPPFKRGFFCDDDGIKYPFIRRQTVPIWAVIITSFVTPVILIVICEMGQHCQKSGLQQRNLQHAQDHITSSGSHIKWPLLHRLSKILLVFLFGALLNLLFTLFGKNCVGRLRPHFLAVCKPNMALVNCSEGYITKFNCTGSNVDYIQDARKSFPSGHASCSMYAMLFLVLYFQSLTTRRKALFLKPFIQFACIMLSLFFGLSRISDYMHFWGDVLAGFGLGAFVAFYMVFVVLDLFSSSAKSMQQRGPNSSEPLCSISRDYRLASVETEVIQ